MIRMVEDGSLLTVAKTDLIQKQVFILFVRLGRNVIRDDRGGRHGNHIVEAEQTELTAGELHDMFAGTDFCMIRLRGFHRDEILIGINAENDTDIGTALPFIKRNTVIEGMQIVDVRF